MNIREILTPGGNLLTGSSNADDDALTPTLVASLESSTHDVNVARAVESVVATAVGELDQLVDNRLALGEGGRVDEVGGAELARPLLLAGVNIDNDDLGSAVGDGTLDDAEADAAGAEDGDLAALLDVGGDGGGAVAGGDAAAEQAGAVHGGLRLHGDDRDVGDDGVLAERGGAHEVEDVLAAGAEAGGAVGHHTLALGGADFAAEVGLARLAELALLALGGVESDDVVAGLDVGDALADGLDDTGTLVSENDREGALGILAGEGVGVCVTTWLVNATANCTEGQARRSSHQGSRSRGREGNKLTCVADTGVLDLDSDLVGLGRSHLNVLIAELLAGAPGDGSLASDGLRKW